MVSARLLFGFVAISACVLVPKARAVDAATPAADRVYAVAVRTSGHAKLSSPEVFESAVRDIDHMLTERGVALAGDTERGWLDEDGRGLETITRRGKDKGAHYVLVVRVDRPVTKWIKFELLMYDVNGTLLWREAVDSGIAPLNGAAGYKKAVEKLGKVLETRVGKEGLHVSK